MRKLLFIVYIISIVGSATAQKNADVGFWGGTATYFGDMSQTDLGSSLGFNYGAFVRYNFNPRIAARFQVMNGEIGATGDVNTNAWSFSKNVTNLSLMAEINFFKYVIGRQEMPFATYMLGGIGIGRFPYNLARETDIFGNGIGLKDRLQPIVGYNVDLVDDDTGGVIFTSVITGFGAKYSIGKKVGIGIEVLLNKYFDDRLDDLDDPQKYFTETTPAVTDPNGTIVTQAQGDWTTYNDRWHNNDYTVYMGFHLTYKINLSKKACPVYEYE